MSSVMLIEIKRGCKMRKEQYIVTGSDESYTYKSLIEPMIDLIEEHRKSIGKEVKDYKIWCPFDLAKDTHYNGVQMFKSNYVTIFKEYGYKVVSSHIAEGRDFFEVEPKTGYDIIISNPPFQNKKLFFERALSFNKPFALVAPLSWINDGALYNLFYENKKQMQMVIPNKRSKFFNEDGCIGKQPSFKSGYICWNFIQGRDIEFITIDTSKDK